MDIIEHWILHKIVDFVSNNNNHSTDNNPNKAGKRFYWTSAVLGENLFKLCAEEEINEDYEEISIDDVLFIRIYEDNGYQIYISTDKKEWNKFTGEVGVHDSEYPNLYCLSDELFNKYIEMNSLEI